MMSRSIKLEDLPIYALEPLGKYLTVSDLNSCCSVSKPWHTIFSQNQFWEKHCNVKVIEYLKSHPCEVDNIGTVLAEDPHISLMSEWRANFVYQNQLRDNWINMRCNIEQIEFPELSTSRHVHFHNDYIFIIHYQYVDVWKIANVPIHITKITFETADEAIDLSPEYDTASWKASNDQFVFAYSNLVRVYDISKVQDNCPVLFSFLFDKTEEESFYATQQPNFQSNLVYSRRELGLVFRVIGDLFIGFTGIPMKRIHIWNIVTKKKVKVEELSTLIDQNSILIDVEWSNTNSDNLVMKFIESTGIELKIYYRIYNITKLEFHPLKVFCRDRCWLSDTTDKKNLFVCAVSNQYFYLQKTENNGWPLLTVYDINQENYVVGEYLLSSNNVRSLVGNNVILFGPNGCTLLSIPSGRSDSIEHPFPINQVHELWDNFLAVNTEYFNYGENHKDMFLWYLGKDIKRTFNHPGQYKSHSPTKLYSVHQKTLYVYSFW